MEVVGLNFMGALQKLRIARIHMDLNMKVLIYLHIGK